MMRRIGLMVGSGALAAAALIAIGLSAFRGAAHAPAPSRPLVGAGDSTVSALTAIGTLHPDDLLMDVDVHDTTMAGTGTNKKLTVAQLFGSPTSGNLIGWSSTATPIVLGSGLSLSGGTLTATGGSGSGTVNSGTASQLAYYASSGAAVSGLTLGTGLSISGGTINATGGSGSGTVGSGTSGQLAYYNATGTAVAGLGVGSGLAISGGNLTATGSGSGTVTTVSVASANGLAGSVANATTTPAITLSTTATGVLKGNGTAISAATAGTDYQAPITLTTTGSSGAATFSGNTLNVPQYSGGGGSPGGSSGALQYNNASAFGGTGNLAYGSNGDLLYTPIADPAAPVAGEEWFSTASKAKAVCSAVDGSSNRLIGTGRRTIFRGTNFTAQTNTASNTYVSLLTGGSNIEGSLTIPAGSLVAGQRLIATFIGQESNFGTIGVTMRLMYNGTAVATTQAFTPGSPITNLLLASNHELSAHVITTGSTGTMAAFGSVVAYTSSSGTQANIGSAFIGDTFGGGAPITVNTSTAGAFDLQIAWTIQETTNSAQVFSFQLDIAG